MAQARRARGGLALAQGAFSRAERAKAAARARSGLAPSRTVRFPTQNGPGPPLALRPCHRAVCLSPRRVGQGRRARRPCR
eukprot:8186382-Pyramimonas_sp.AAC.1